MSNPYEDHEHGQEQDEQERRRFLVDQAKRDAFQKLIKHNPRIALLFLEDPLEDEESKENPHRKIGFGFTVENRGKENMRCVPTMNVEVFRRMLETKTEWGKRREIEVTTEKIQPEIVQVVLQNMHSDNLKTIANFFLLNSLDFWTDVSEAEDPSYEATLALRHVFAERYRQLTGSDMPDGTYE